MINATRPSTISLNAYKHQTQYKIKRKFNKHFHCDKFNYSILLFQIFGSSVWPSSTQAGGPADKNVWRIRSNSFYAALLQIYPVSAGQVGSF